ncbi:MAG: DUF3341 domain-containing protein [Phycisphaeraceae bacterium]|nr:MAG: DUF3341 domain-containing protein [Phycisphaeraceae bacterium]
MSAHSVTSSSGAPLHAIMAEFPNPAVVSHAAEKIRDLGYSKWDVYSPFPIHGIDEAMGLKPSRVSFFAGAGAISGITIALLMQWWMSAVDYPMVIGGKPYFAWEQYFPVTFELAVLMTSISAIVGMLTLNGLPLLHHPMAKKERFLRVGDDRFIIAIEAADPKFNADDIRKLLADLGGEHIDEVEE